MLRAAKFRIYPTAEQEHFLWGQWGAVRFCWNKALYLKNHFYERKGISLDPIKDLKPLIARAKKSPKYGWLKQYDSMCLQEALRHNKKGWTNFFEHRTRKPRYKRRRGPQSSYHCTCVSVGADFVKVPKMEPIRARIHRPVEGEVKSITLEADTTGAYYAAVLWEDKMQEPEPITEVREDKVTGLDVGIKDLLTESNGRKEPNPKHKKKARKNLRRKQKKFSRTKKGSRRREKARLKLARAHKRVANAREDHLHKVSRRLVNENQALVVESVKPKNMLKNHRLAEAIADAAWGKFIGMLAYKLRREGKVLVKIDTFYPSSKTCSCCGFKLPELELKTRKWSCPKCGALHDRDINAAVNIKAEGIRQLRAAGLSVLRSAELSGNCEIALGDGVRPRENRGCCR